MNRVVVATTDTMSFHHVGLFEFTQNSLNRAFGDSDLVRDVSDPRIALLRDANEDVAVVTQERPSAGFTGFHNRNHKSGIDNRQD